MKREISTLDELEEIAKQPEQKQFAILNYQMEKLSICVGELRYVEMK